MATVMSFASFRSGLLRFPTHPCSLQRVRHASFRVVQRPKASIPTIIDYNTTSRLVVSVVDQRRTTASILVLASSCLVVAAVTVVGSSTLQSLSMIRASCQSRAGSPPQFGASVRYHSTTHSIHHHHHLTTTRKRTVPFVASTVKDLVEQFSKSGWLVRMPIGA